MSYNLSQEEIDELVKEMEDYIPSNNKSIDINNQDKCTVHKWVNYVGLQETFVYCEICDEKQKD